MDPLAIKFEEEIRAKMLHAKKECRYNPTRFNQMIAKYGGVETAKRLIANALQTGNTSDGFTTLCLYGRLDSDFEVQLMSEKRKPAIRQRPIQVKFFVDERELGLIKANMAQLGIENMSAYLRQVAIDRYEKKPDMPECRETKNP